MNTFVNLLQSYFLIFNVFELSPFIFFDKSITSDDNRGTFD